MKKFLLVSVFASTSLRAELQVSGHFVATGEALFTLGDGGAFGLRIGNVGFSFKP
jgi:hypothetical protein